MVSSRGPEQGGGFLSCLAAKRRINPSLASHCCRSGGWCFTFPSLPLPQVTDASTQTALPNPASPGNQNFAWGTPVLPPAPSSHAIAEKLDAVQMEIQKLSQALHAVLERQCRLERQQEHQQRLQQEVLMTLQQLSSTVSHGTLPANQPCVPFSSVAEPSPTMPNFSQFKMELI